MDQLKYALTLMDNTYPLLPETRQTQISPLSQFGEGMQVSGVDGRVHCLRPAVLPLDPGSTRRQVTPHVQSLPVTKGQSAIRDLFRVVHDRTGNLPPLPGVFPDYPAPIARVVGGEREMAMARWGMPSRLFA